MALLVFCIDSLDSLKGDKTKPVPFSQFFYGDYSDAISSKMVTQSGFDTKWFTRGNLYYYLSINLFSFSSFCEASFS